MGGKLLALEFSVGCESRVSKSDSGVVSKVSVAGCGETATIGMSARGSCR